MGNLGAVDARPEPSHGLEHSVLLNFPPLAIVFLRPDNGAAAQAGGTT
jgi:hypothetical protein